ncbi:hypothetical protein [Bacillus sp. KH172YL63]|uniref:hypothetical protein n=1 Tax=Bacillus sp. KH172YL63 TaxID=2709784 RepID=UPI001565C13A|nr:hypothetical protein [Bacillus sp. KH172YL63]
MISFLLFYLLVIPLCVLLHEIGHGLGAVVGSGAHAHVYLGSREGREQVKLGRMHFHIIWSYSGYCSWDGSLSNRRKLAALAGGPLMSLLIASICGWLSVMTPDGALFSILRGTAIFSTIQFFLTACPMTYPGWMKGYGGLPSDGMQMVRLIKKFQ